jgi:hypothetical protein
MAEKVLSKIISCTRSAKYFPIIANCTADINLMEQLFVTIRYVDARNGNNEN